ncbi:selenocysteine lyase/cysteine desulfurase [Halarchaeum rubridurum]|uniref:Cysteine desulfurase n=1 Tax=Halarchaeum rubridurum TaxID=489911 RepID=A0A830G2Q6_9EURY|nr:aminotransferase class V-fold PLP-dependent enzyme [Halarchaeum rubridurum]MBP1955339.1 selenocysteine lyase/cysteine desulfurase [Halarchaeum rubridurum]GGM71621.1 cysteine desulfurase [Halarchaeum rubridurum]
MDPETLRADIPALDDATYLNTGASGPSPERVVEAAEAALERHEYEAHATENPYVSAAELFDDARERLAAHLDTDPSSVALTQSTTDGVNRIATAIDWEPGDVVVRTDVEHAAGVLPWRRLRDSHGVRTRVVPTTGGRIDRAAYREAVADARLVCLSALTWTHGTRLPVADLVDEAHDAGAEVLVDAVQVPGQAPMPVESWGADYVAAAGHKWLCGPWGAGFLYVDPDAAERLEPLQVGYRSVRDPEGAGYEFHPGARRLEVGTVSPGPHAGLMEALDVVEEVGLDAIRDRIDALTERFVDGLADDRLLGPDTPESGLVAFESDDPEALVAGLRERGVVVRALPTGAVRASFHVFNTAEDVERLLTAMADVEN